MQPAANPALSSLPSTTEQPPASLSARKDAANTKLQQLRRFAAHCASLFGQEVLPGEEDLHSASFDTVAAALTLQLGASVLKDLAVSRLAPPVLAAIGTGWLALLPVVLASAFPHQWQC